MRAHLVQLNIAWEDKQANHATVERLLDRAAPGEGDLVILPEMFDTGFSFNVERTADRDSATLRMLMRLAEDLGIYIMGGRTIHACHACLAHNRACVISPAGDLLADYAKIHPFSYSRESERFEGGDEIVLFTWSAPEPAARQNPSETMQHSPQLLTRQSGARTNSHSNTQVSELKPEAAPTALRVCPTICYDLRFPELFRHGLLRGAELFTVIANWPHVRQQHWRALLIARAIENQSFVLGINRTGSDPYLKYAGGSIAIDPRGEIIGELDDEETILTVDLDPAMLHQWRDTFPAWRDIRLIS